MVKFLKPDATTSQNLATGALSYTTSFSTSKPWKLLSVEIKASQNITEEITLTRDSASGANYDTILRKKSLSAEQNFLYKPEGGLVFQAGDQLKVACTNANLAGTVYLSIKAMEIS